MTQMKFEDHGHLLAIVDEEFFDSIDKGHQNYPIVSVAHFGDDCVVTIAHTRNGPVEYAAIVAGSTFFKGFA